MADPLIELAEELEERAAQLMRPDRTYVEDKVQDAYTDIARLARDCATRKSVAPRAQVELAEELERWSWDESLSNEQMIGLAEAARFIREASEPAQVDLQDVSAVKSGAQFVYEDEEM